MTDQTIADQIEDERRKISGDRADAATHQAAPVSPFAPTIDRIRRLRKATQAASRQEIVNLPGLSIAYGARVDVRLIETSMQEVVASGFLPGTSRHVVSSFIRRAEEITAEDRAKLNMDSLISDVIKEEFGGDQLEVAAGVYQLLRALAVLGVKEFLFDGEPNEPNIYLTIDRDDSRPYALYVGELPEIDVEAITTAVLANIEKESADAEPFLGSSNATGIVGTIKSIRGEAVNARQV